MNLITEQRTRISEEKLYGEHIGGLIYMANATRSDLPFSE